MPTAVVEVAPRKRSKARKAKLLPPEPAREVPGPGERPARLPYLLDLYPAESAAQTRLAPFFEGLREGRFLSTHCRKDGRVLWPPRIVCPVCHTSDLTWVDLPQTGRIYAFSAILAGAPSGLEEELPRVVGLVELDGSPLRIFGRIVGVEWPECRIGMRVRVEPFSLPDGRAYYAFRVVR